MAFTGTVWPAPSCQGHHTSARLRVKGTRVDSFDRSRVFSSSQASPCLLPLGLASGCGSLVGGPTAGTHASCNKESLGVGEKVALYLRGKPSSSGPLTATPDSRQHPPPTCCSSVLPRVCTRNAFTWTHRELAWVPMVW